MLRLAEWAVRDVLEGGGFESVVFTGEESQRVRTRNVVSFHDEAHMRVMFLTDAGGVGLNLQRAANARINLELPWNPAVLEQRVGRIYRIGQKDPIDVINLVAEYGIEARIADLIGSKQALFSGLFDGTTDAVRFEAKASFLGDIERLVEHLEVRELPPGAEDGAEPPGDDAADVNTLDELSSAELAREVGASPLHGELPAASAPPRAGEPSEAVVAGEAGAPRSSEHANGGSRAAAGNTRGEIRQLFEQISVSRAGDGGLRIHAPPDAARQLAHVLEGLAGLLRTVE